MCGRQHKELAGFFPYHPEMHRGREEEGARLKGQLQTFLKPLDHVSESVGSCPAKWWSAFFEGAVTGNLASLIV
jgi:hypothetical protein